MEVVYFTVLMKECPLRMESAYLFLFQFVAGNSGQEPTRPKRKFPKIWVRQRRGTFVHLVLHKLLTSVLVYLSFLSVCVLLFLFYFLILQISNFKKQQIFTKLFIFFISVY